MKRSSILAVLAALCVVLALNACGKKDGGDDGMNMTASGAMSLIKVVFSTDPAEIHAGKPVTLKATVTQDGKPVNDASEMKFEIRKAGAKDSRFETGKLDKAGVYTAAATFEDAGEYEVTAHTTAHSIHSMPVTKVQVKP